MPAFVCLAKMELNGFGFSEDECEKQRKIIVARLEELEQEAYTLAGRPFSLTSPEDGCQVFYFFIFYSSIFPVHVSSPFNSSKSYSVRAIALLV